MRAPAALVAVAVALAAAGPALGAKGNERYHGETEDGRAVKLVADERGAVIRGAITAETACTRG